MTYTVVQVIACRCLENFVKWKDEMEVKGFKMNYWKTKVMFDCSATDGQGINIRLMCRGVVGEGCGGPPSKDKLLWRFSECSG